MASYNELNALPAVAFLTPSLFKTSFDYTHSEQAREAKYQKALQLGKAAKQVFISQNTTWGAIMKDESHVYSYEGIGYHAITSYLLQGFLDSGCEILVYREGKKPERIQ